MIKLKILFRLIAITITATDIMIALVEILLEILAAMGEASALPKINPVTAAHLVVLPNIQINVSELNSAMKKRDSLTVPSEKRGLRPPAISVDNTIDPQ